jgi:Spy/CpxP family protein refolding chaperone
MRILTVFLATALAATPLLAQGRRGPGGGDRTPTFDAVKEALSLTDAQLATIQENNAALREQMKAVFDEARQKREALEAELENANPNPTIVGQLVIDARASHAQAEELRTATVAQNAAVLDAQQQAALTALAEAGRSAALREAAMLSLIEGAEGHGPRGGFGMDGGPRRGGPRG